MIGRNIEVNIISPVKWKTDSFWMTKRGRTCGIVLAFSPTTFALGIEAITGSSRGLALFVGPLWIGFATLRPSRPSEQQVQS